MTPAIEVFAAFSQRIANPGSKTRNTPRIVIIRVWQRLHDAALASLTPHNINGLGYTDVIPVNDIPEPLTLD